MSLKLKEEFLKLLEEDKIVYLNTELFLDIEKFQETLILISKKDFNFIFINKVTSLENWWKPLKGLLNAKEFLKILL
jgi:predicted AAA+ superfamily ATPase